MTFFWKLACLGCQQVRISAADEIAPMRLLSSRLIIRARRLPRIRCYRRSLRDAPSVLLLLILLLKSASLFARLAMAFAIRLLRRNWLKLALQRADRRIESSSFTGRTKLLETR